MTRFDCAYNAIIGRPRLAMFMTILHYTYMMVKMIGLRRVVTMKADFWASVECYRGTIQMALALNTLMAQKQ